MTLARALGLLSFAYVGTLISTVLAVMWSGPVPDLGFLVALYAGLHCRLSGGPTAMLRDSRPEAMVGLGAALGYVMDLVGGTPRGLRALACALWLLGLRSVSNRLMVRGVSAVVGVATLSMLLFRLSMWLLHTTFAAEAEWSGLRNAIGEALVTGLAAPLLFSALRRMDSWLWRDPRMQRGGLAYESSDAKR
jgi:rod shape-determining protein MreD